MDKFKEQISLIFGYTHFGYYKEDPAARTVSFEYGNNGVTFAQLHQLAELLGTNYIDFVGDTEEVRYSSDTVDTDRRGELYCKFVKF